MTRQDVPSPIGDLVLVEQAGALVVLDFAHGFSVSESYLRRYFPGLKLKPGTCRAAVPLHDYLAGDSSALGRVEWRVQGTDFQRTVWQALESIPFGETVSYLQLAQQIARPKAVRAVANAVGSNPLAIVLPCHRVMGSDGNLTGFRGGLDKKRWLLAHEGVDV
jgi:methylated-DNA-[protein]-cysteine S-methyltransferase